MQIHRLLSVPSGSRGITLSAVRHGEADSDPLGNNHKETIIRGQIDSPLTEVGHQEAREAARKLAHLEQPVVYSSGLSRARDTAQAYIDESGAPFYQDARLNEIAYGECEGLTLKEFGRLFPDRIQRWPTNFLEPYPAGESRLDVACRLQSWLQEVAQKHPHQTVVVFSHIEAMGTLKALLGVAPLDSDGALKLVPGEFETGQPLKLV